MQRYLVVFDDECNFCRSWVAWILQKDKKKEFCFTGLTGKLFQKYSHLISAKDLGRSVLFIEDFQTNPKILIYGKAALKICFRLPGIWKVIGLLHFLPKVFIDPVYKLIAKRRQKHCKDLIDLSRWRDRFYP